MNTETLLQMCADLHSQDNRATSHPIFEVQELVGYREDWRHVHSFFTERAADRYMKTQAHNHKKLRTYVMSANQNPELRMLRKLLMSDAFRDFWAMETAEREPVEAP